MPRYIASLCLSVLGGLLNGCSFECPNNFAQADTLTIVGTIPDFDGHRPCGGTDGECWAIGEAIVTYTDGSVKTWTETRGTREFFIRSESFGDDGSFDWSLHELEGDAFSDEKEVADIRYRIELVNRHSEGSSTITVRTAVCFEGTAQSERVIPLEQDPFILPHERGSCDVSRRTNLEVEVEFVSSQTCPS